MSKPCKHGHVDGAKHNPCYKCKAEAHQNKVAMLERIIESRNETIQSLQAENEQLKALLFNIVTQTDGLHAQDDFESIKNIALGARNIAKIGCQHYSLSCPNTVCPADYGQQCLCQSEVNND